MQVVYSQTAFLMDLYIVYCVVLCCVAATAWPSTYKMWVWNVRAKIACIRPDPSARTSRVRRPKRLPPHVSAIDT